MKRFLPILVVLPLVMAQDPKPKAPNVRELATKGADAWEKNKDAATAIAYFQKAISAIQEAGGGLAACLPKPLKDWIADKPRDSSYAGGSGAQTFTMVTITQKHTRKSDNATARFTITNSPQLMASFKQMIKLYKNPQYAQTMKSAGMEIEERGKWTILHSTKRDRSESMAIHESVMAQVQLSVLDKDLARKLIERFALDNLEKRSAKTADASK